MRKIVDYFVNNSFVVNLLAGFIVFSGYIALTMMNRDLHPPFEFDQVRVTINMFGSTPKEVEKLVTTPVEEALRGMRGVEEITSKSSSGVSSIRLQFESGFDDINEAPELIRSKIDSIRRNLPSNIRDIQVNRSRTNDVFLYWLGVEDFDEENLRHLSFLNRVETELRDIPGVVKVDPWNRNRDLYVEFYPDKLARYEVSVNDARRVLEQALNFAPIGETRVKDSRFSVEISQVANTIEEIRELPILANRSGGRILLKDIALVHFKLAEESSQEFVNGTKGISIGVRKDLTSDTVDLKEKVLAAIGRLNESAPDNVKIISLVDGAQFVERQLDVLKKNGFVGAILVLLILMVFLNWRTATMTAIGLPVAYMGTLIVLHAMGMNFDLITLIGLILVIGILVDDAIIVSERYVENIEKGLAPRKAATQAVMDLILPVTGTITTTLVAFSPLLLIESRMGTILAAVPIIVISALFLSWFESFFVLPNHLGHFVKKPPVQKTNLFSKVKSGYERALTFTLRWRYLALGFTIALLVLSGWIAATKLKHDFNLRVNSERLSVYVSLNESPSLEETRKQIKPIEDYLMQLPKTKVENFFTSVGWVWMNGKRHEGYQHAKINAYLYRDEKHPSKLKNEIKSDLEKFIETIKGPQFDKIYVEVERGDNNEEKNNMVSVRVKGKDEFDYIKVENAIVDASKDIKVIQEFVKDPQLYQKTWEFVPKPSALAEYKLTPTLVARELRGQFVPDEIAQVRWGGEDVRIFFEIKRDEDPKFEELNGLEVLSPNGVSVPLRFIGEWKIKDSLKSISHHNGQRNLTLDFKLNEGEGNVEVAKKDLKSAVAGVMTAFPGTNIEVIDTNEDEAKSRAWAMKVAIVCIIGVLFVIAMVLKSLTQPFIVGMPIPFGLIGIFLALYVHQMPLGLMALIGLVGVIGVSVNASIVMVDQINKKVRDQGGKLTKEILIAGASSRLRAIMLTTLTTLGGVFPMAYSLGGESGFTQPLAFSMGWGLTASTLLTLFVLPSLLWVREDVLNLVDKVFKRKSKENIEWEMDPAAEIKEKSSKRPDLQL